jgi:hypothetical protein
MMVVNCHDTVRHFANSHRNALGSLTKLSRKSHRCVTKTLTETVTKRESLTTFRNRVDSVGKKTLFLCQLSPRSETFCQLSRKSHGTLAEFSRNYHGYSHRDSNGISHFLQNSHPNSHQAVNSHYQRQKRSRVIDKNTTVFDRGIVHDRKNNRKLNKIYFGQY